MRKTDIKIDDIRVRDIFSSMLLRLEDLDIDNCMFETENEKYVFSKKKDKWDLTIINTVNDSESSFKNYL